jgi:hypothetical protein
MLHSRQPHPIFSQSEHVEASSSPAQCTISMAENAASTGHPLLTYILSFKWTHKIHASLPHCLITVTFMTQRPHYLHSLALLLSLSLIHRRLLNYGTPAMALGLKLTNHSSPGTHVTFSQTLSFSQALSLSLYHLLLYSSQTLKKSPLKSSLPYAHTNIIPRTWTVHAISVFKSKQPFFSRYYALK